jgi:hypothetical protein
MRMRVSMSVRTAELTGVGIGKWQLRQACGSSTSAGGQGQEAACLPRSSGSIMYTQAHTPCTDICVYTKTGTQAHRHTGTQAHRHTDKRARAHTHTHS